MSAPRIAVACATQRGVRFLETLVALKPAVDLLAFSFPEQPWEPKYVDEIRTLVEAHGGTFTATRNLGSSDLLELWRARPVDLLFFINWRYLVPSAVYSAARLGTFAIHDSLLPEYRGFSPTNWAIINGADHTGATLFQLTDEMDAGDIVAQVRVPIAPTDTIAMVMPRVSDAYVKLLTDNLDGLLQGTVRPMPQDHRRATYTCRRLPEDNLIDWSRSATDVHNLIRAVSEPYPGAFTYLEGRKVAVWKAALPARERSYVGSIPGRVAEIIPGEGSIVLTGDGAILLQQVQAEGGETVCASELLNNLSMQLGRAYGQNRP